MRRRQDDPRAAFVEALARRHGLGVPRAWPEPRERHRAASEPHALESRTSPAGLKPGAAEKGGGR